MRIFSSVGSHGSKGAHYERGSALVEFALASVVALTLIFGVIECGRLLFEYHTVSNAARLGSRYAIVHGSDCSATLSTCQTASATDIANYVAGLSPGINPNNVTTNWVNGSACAGTPFMGAGCNVTVTVTYNFTSVIPLLNLKTIALTSSSTMVIAQ